MIRSHKCWELRKTHVWETVKIAWWVDDVRDMWGLVFLTIRDRYGVTQVQIDADSAEMVGHEYCVAVEWVVQARPEGQENTAMPTGAIEIVAQELTVLNKSKELPFPIRENPNTSEEQRFKHRFLDLRRRNVLENIEFRAKMNHVTRNRFVDQWFLEVQTPLFTVSSPEWARDYVIPSRVNPWKFYALPQAPQQYKQLLMVWGVDKYFQIAPCFRDEDPRADRHSCEFYQVDAEMSFVDQEDIFTICEWYMHHLIKELVPNKEITVDFQRIPHNEAMNRYGSDKPDVRFGMEFLDISDLVRDVEFGVFSKTVQDGGVVKAIKLSNETMSRKDIDAVTDVAKQAGAKWLAYFICEESDAATAGVRSPITKFFKPVEIQTITNALDAQPGDMIFFWAWANSLVNKVLNKVRLYLRDTYDLVDDSKLAFVWITDFPFYEYDERNERWDFGHNPFSQVVWWVEAINTKDFADIQTTQYDMVLNGYEILSGSIRNHDPEVMVAAFEKLWLSEKDVKERFGAMYEAFQYGAPPHGGFAFGFDRLMMILIDEPNIRECYAFPKSGRAQDVMMGAPAPLLQEDLDLLSIDLNLEDDVNE